MKPEDGSRLRGSFLNIGIWNLEGMQNSRESRKRSSSMALAFRRPFAVRRSMWWGDMYDGRAVGRSGPYGGEGRTAGRSVCGESTGGAAPVLGRLMGFADASLPLSLILGAS